MARDKCFPVGRRWTVFAILAWIAGAGAAGAQPNVDIYSWTPATGQVRAEDVRIRPAADTLAAYGTDGFFDAAQLEAVSPIKSQNAVYFRLHSNGSSPVLDGTVTVQADYAEAAAGLAPEALAAAVAAVPAGGWQPLGSRIMDLEILLPPGDPPGYGLLPGATFPTDREVSLPDRYRIDCMAGCAQPLPVTFFLRVTLSLGGVSDPATDVALSYYDMSNALPPSDVVILHDLSGSMLGELPWAKQRAKMFIDLLNAGDRVGLVGFSTAFPGNAHLAASLAPIATVDPSDPTRTFVKGQIDAPLFAAGGGTPMGSGVLSAQSVLDAVADPRPNRAIVMLTDGMENVDPRLQAPGYPILTGLNTDAKGAIALYPLWFGALGDYGKALLEDITMHVTHGKLVEQPGDDLKLAEVYLMIRGILTHDDVYAIHRGIAGDGYESAIDVDDVTDELILTIAWHTFGTELDVSVLPPGESTWRPAAALATSTSRDQLYAVHRFRDPRQGVWRYRLEQRGRNEPYVLAALADKVRILMQSDLADYSVAAGEPLVINARLTQSGRPVKGAVVRATVLGPRNSLGTLLHGVRDRLTTPLTPDPAAETPRAAGIARELPALVGADALLPAAPVTVELRDDDGDGTYSGSFTDTRVAGTYRVTITAESAPGTGEGFRREHRHAAVVSLGPIDDQRSVVKVFPLARPGQEGATLYAVQVIPADVHGNFIDPGYGSRLQVDATGGRWLSPLIDNQDGSYVRALELVPGERADVVVTAFGKRLPRRSTTGTGTTWGGRRREFSLHTGLAEPARVLRNLIERSPNVTLDLGYHLRELTTAVLLLGAHDLARKDGGREWMWQVSGDLRQRLSERPLAPYVQGGLGAYRLFGTWDAGANLGFGWSYRVSPTVALETGIDYHHIVRSGDDAGLWQLHVGTSIDF